MSRAMAKSKHRKKPSRPVRKRRIAPSVEETVPHKIKLRGPKFDALRKNPDFIALVKMGRVVNAISFGIQCISDYMDQTSPVAERQRNRAVLVTGGYLHEGLSLVGSMRVKYITEPFFAKLNALVDSEEYKKKRKILKELRNSVGFHLDSDDKTTRKTIASMGLKRWPLASGESARMLDFYFDFADAVDFNFLIDTYNAGESEETTFLEIVRSVSDMFPPFQQAGHEFIIGLSEKLQIWEYID